jgi:hypothetical protein
MNKLITLSLTCLALSACSIAEPPQSLQSPPTREDALRAGAGFEARKPNGECVSSNVGGRCWDIVVPNADGTWTLTTFSINREREFTGEPVHRTLTAEQVVVRDWYAEIK